MCIRDSIYVNTYDTAKVNKSDAQIAKIVNQVFDMRPYAIEQRLKLRTPIYSETAAYGHMGRQPKKKKVSFVDGSGKTKSMTVETFPWEKLDYVKKLKTAFKVK